MNTELDKIYEKFIQEFKVSDKQKAFIIKLCKEEEGEEEEGEVFKKISEIMKKEITDWDGIKTHSQVSRIINNLKRSQNNFKQKDVDFSIKIRETPIEVTSDYEIGYQYSNYGKDKKLYYIKFFDMMMLDYDGESSNLENIKDSLKKYDYSYRIYKTYNGYHIFITSDNLRYNMYQSVMRDLNCDEYFCKFTFKYGYKVRLNPKINREENIAATFLEVYNPKNISEKQDLIELLKLHDNLLIKYKQY